MRGDALPILDPGRRLNGILRTVRGVPVDRVIVSESGLATRQDLAQLARFGVRCFLIGETLMREHNVELATRELLRSPWTPEAE